MGPRARAVSLLAALASFAALQVKSRWRAPRPRSYRRVVLCEGSGECSKDAWNAAYDSQAHRPPYVDLPFTPALACEPDTSVFVERFDWKVTPVSPYYSGDGRCGLGLDSMPWRNITFENDPQTVWAVPHAVGRVLHFAERHCDPSHNNRIVVFAGTEMSLTDSFGKTVEERRATVARLRKYFRKISHQTKDEQLEGVDLAPMGLSWGYLMALMLEVQKREKSPTLQFDFARSLVAGAARSGLAAKSRVALATYSKVASYLDVPGFAKKVFTHLAKSTDPIYTNITNSSARIIADSIISRRKMREWMRTPAAVSAGVELRSIPVIDYWRELLTYKFLLAPMGTAIQTAKTYEALLALTIPVIVHSGYSAFFELARMGFPLVIISSWVEVTAANFERWWREVSPRLESFRRNCLTLEGYWRMVTGQVGRCT